MRSNLIKLKPAKNVNEWIDPHSVIRENESGMRGKKLLDLARHKGWKRRRIYGRLWIHKGDYLEWLQEKVSSEIRGKAAAK